MYKKLLIGVASIAGICAPLIASAHEVYVLDPATVQRAMAVQSPNPFSAITGNEGTFFFWGFVTFVAFSTALAASIFRPFERRLDPLLYTLKKYALPVARITVGLCFIAFAYSGNLYGSELFLSQGFGSFAPALQCILAILGITATLGVATRLTGAGMLTIYAAAYWVFGSYILTYTDFLGAALLITILGGGLYSIDSRLGKEPLHIIARLTSSLRPYAFPLARICFGWGVLFASVYAKYLHSELAYQVVVQYDLTRFFPFDPLFVVLGALIIEFISGAMVLLGIAVRWTLIFLAFWLTLSLIYFQELIWPHGILFGLAIALFLHGYDRFSLQGVFFKKSSYEPVL